MCVICAVFSKDDLTHLVCVSLFPQKRLGDILAFPTGSDAVPLIGFSPKPSLDSLHQSGAQRLPTTASLVSDCLSAVHQNEFYRMNFELRNTQGFSMV